MPHWRPVVARDIIFYQRQPPSNSEFLAKEIFGTGPPDLCGVCPRNSTRVPNVSTVELIDGVANFWDRVRRIQESKTREAAVNHSHKQTSRSPKFLQSGLLKTRCTFWGYPRNSHTAFGKAGPNDPWWLGIQFL